MNPKVSVILPVYNAGQFLRDAIQSVLDQTFTDFELIILNDASTDASEAVILEYSDKRIRYFKNASNMGLIRTLNKGLSLARGEYIARMDQDDISLPGRFKKQVAFLDLNKEVAVVAARLLLINEKGLSIGYWPEDFNASSVGEIKSRLPISNCIGHPTVMMRSKPVKEIGYDEGLRNSEDWGLWLNLLAQGFVIAKISEVVLHYRVHDKSTTVQANNSGVEVKVLAFKWAYLTGKLRRLSLKKTDRAVARSFANELMRYLLKPMLGPARHFIRLPWLAILKQRIAVGKQLSSLKDPVGLICVFPYYHTGGAEKVHASILEAVQSESPLTLITRTSEDQAFLAKFNAFSRVVEVDQLLKSGSAKRWLMKKIKALSSASTTVFSSNAEFFYELVAHLPEEVKCVDLIHAFVHLNEVGPERWSLPVVHRLHTRVVINQKTKADFDYFYKAHEIAPAYLLRILYIPNFVEQKTVSEKNYSQVLKVLYAGRGSVEKRLHLIAQVAQELSVKKLPVEFHFAGNVKEFIPPAYREACILHGNIIEEKQMDELYAASHFLIMASSREGFPMVIMEAMMQGVVPVSTAVGGIAEHVHSKENGILINDSDEAAIVRQFVVWFEHCLAHREELSELAYNAHKYAVQHFNKEDFFNAYLQLLKSK